MRAHSAQICASKDHGRPFLMSFANVQLQTISQTAISFCNNHDHHISFKAWVATFQRSLKQFTHDFMVQRSVGSVWTVHAFTHFEVSTWAWTKPAVTSNTPKIKVCIKSCSQALYFWPQHSSRPGILECHGLFIQAYRKIHHLNMLFMEVFVIYGLPHYYLYFLPFALQPHRDKTGVNHP